jgi:hypothetical protein
MSESKLTVHQELFDRALRLVGNYLQAGCCACRFPRFRSIAQRDTSRALGVSCRGEDQVALIAAFEKLMPLSERSALGPFPKALDGMWQATCLRCSSQVERSSNEIVPGGWADYLVIRRAATSTELGAPVDRLYRCRPLAPLGGGMQNMREAMRLYPLIDENDWFSWLQERRT